MNHLKEDNSSSYIDIINQNPKNYARFKQKNRPSGMAGKKNRLLKSLGIGTMAVFIGVLAVFGTACTPAEMLPEKPTQGQNFDLGLNPETDPVVFTTASGLQIKKSNAKYGSTTTTTTNTGYTYTQDLTSFYYFTMGTFSGTIYTAKTLTDNYKVTNEPVNWLIIGRGEMPVADNSPAGSAIQGDAGKQEIALGSSIYENLNLSAIPENSDIPEGCFLVLSEKLLGNMYFNSKGSINQHLHTTEVDHHLLYADGNYGNRYRFFGNIDTASGNVNNQTWTTGGNAGGSLYNYINNLFKKNNSSGAIEGDNTLGFSKVQADLIIPQQLYTYYYNGSSDLQETPSTDGGTYYTMFPLAYRTSSSTIFQNFCIEDYLKTTTQRTATLIGSSINQSYWWSLRSGTAANVQGRVSVTVSGGFYVADWARDVAGVRPAMVMKLA